MAYKDDLFKMLLINFFVCICICMQSVLISLILGYVDSDSNDISILHGFVLISAYIGLDLLQNIMTEQISLIQNCLEIKIKNGVTSLIFDKVLRISSSSSKEFSHGEIINLISIDINKIRDICIRLTLVIRFPILVVFGFVLLISYFGYSIVAAFVVGLTSFMILFAIEKLLARIEALILYERDKRMNLTTEIITSIKVIKLNSLKDIYARKILRIRNQELFYDRLKVLFECFKYWISWMSSPLMIIAMLYTYFWTGNSITVAKAFAGIQVLYFIERPLRWFPDFLGKLFEFEVSTKRINRFLTCNEFNAKLISECDYALKKKKIDLYVQNANFTWNFINHFDENKINEIASNIKFESIGNDLSSQCELDQKPNNQSQRKSALYMTLKNISLQIKKGELICVVGEVSSGKSSLINSIIGELLYLDSDTFNKYSMQPLDNWTNKVLNSISNSHKNKIRLNGSVSLVQQSPWIQNMTIRDNILFGLPFDKQKYKKVVSACQLTKDFEMLKGGDNIEVGEKGVNLSGGQKARISIARACYSDCDIVLLDDPLSALDSRVKACIFEDVICGELKSKTRILATHCTDYIHKADRIVVVDNGSIKHVGTYEEIACLKDLKHLNNCSTKHLILNCPDRLKDVELDEFVSVSESCSNNILSKIRIIEDEQNEVIDVGWEVYYDLFVRDWNWIAYAAVVPLFVIYSFCAINVSYSYGKWIENADNETLFWMNFRLSIIFTVVYGFSVFMISLIIFLSTLRKSRNIFYVLLPYVTICYKMCIAAMNSIWIICALPVFGVMLVMVIKDFIATYRELSRLETVNASPLISFIGETIEGVPTIRTFKRQQLFINRNYEYLDSIMNAAFWKGSIECWFNIRIKLISLSIFAITCVLCILFKDSTSSVLFGVLLISFCDNGIDILLGSLVIAKLESSMVSYQRCLKMTDIPQENQTSDVLVPCDWPSRGCVQFAQFSAKYRDNTDLVLKNLNFTIQPTQKIGVVGRTGAGKSTIVLALCRIIEADSGAIFIDGVNISRISTNLLRDKITIIPQDPTLFEGTLRFNIDPHGVASDDEIIELIQQASLLGLIRRSEHGLDQHIDSRGTNLSSGEKQLICICRAIVRNSKIVVMDEATANIDTKTENTIQTLVNNRFRDATVITIAHRLNTIISSDKILIIDDGMVAEYNSPEMLLKDKASLLSSLIKKVARD